MRILISVFTVLLLTGLAYGDNLSPVLVECNSFMKLGFLRPNERGVFRWSSSPFKISISVDSKDIAVTDVKTFCNLPVSSRYGEPIFSTSQQRDGAWLNLSFRATRGVLEDEVGSIRINESNLNGIFTCSDFDMPDDVKLSNCKIQY